MQATQTLTPLEQFLALPEGERAELLHNSVIMSPSASFAHQKVQRRFGRALELYFLKQNLTHELLYSSFDVYLDEENIVVPDLLLVLKDRKSIITEKGVMGAPDLVLEIISPSNARNDLVTKKRIYEQAGVPEYWIIDPIKKKVVVFVLDDGKYQLKVSLVKEGPVSSEILTGFQVKVSELFEY